MVRHSGPYIIRYFINFKVQVYSGEKCLHLHSVSQTIPTHP